MNKYRSRTPISKRRLGTETHQDRRLKRKQKRGEVDAYETDLQQEDVFTYSIILNGEYFQIESTSEIDACETVYWQAIQQQLIDANIVYDITIIYPNGVRAYTDTQKFVIGNDK